MGTKLHLYHNYNIFTLYSIFTLRNYIPTRNKTKNISFLYIFYSNVILSIILL